MKKFASIILSAVSAAAMLPFATGCTDVSGDGIDSVVWNGSQNIANTHYHNPVWEPDLNGGTVLKTTTGFIAIAPQVEWVNGLIYNAPALSSTNLMDWDFNNQAEAFPSLSQKEDSLVTDVAALYSRTVARTSYWLFYITKDAKTIRAAYASTGLGPYTDAGVVVDVAQTGDASLSCPSAINVTSKNYIFYTTPSGTYCQELTIRPASLPKLKGQRTLVAGPEFTDVQAFRMSKTDFYLFGTVKGAAGTEIHYARAEKIDGTYKGQDGHGILDGQSTGSLLVRASQTYADPQNLNGVFEASGDSLFVTFTATETAKPQLSSGKPRRPLFLYYAPRDEQGWFTTLLEPVKGWATPKFK